MNSKHKYLYFLSFLIFSAFNVCARPCNYNLDSIVEYSDFIDNVEIIYYHNSQLSVKSKIDGLTYTFLKETGPNHQNFPNPKTEYILIRGRQSSDITETPGVVLGELVKNEYLFYIWDGEHCSYISTNPAAKISNSKDFNGYITYPKSFFKFKTPSQNWSEEEKEANSFLFLSGKLEKINFQKFHTQYINDTIHIATDSIDSNHLKLIMHFKVNKISGPVNEETNMKSILNSIGLPYNDIVAGSDRTTTEFDFRHPINSYSNKTYKLITYKHVELAEETIVIMDLHKR